LTRTEYLIELISDSDDINHWWVELDSTEEARELLKEVKREDQGEREIATLLSFFDEPDLFEMPIQKAFNKCLSILNRKLTGSI
jgi:uncharacterized protein involved in tolerance to divalent cations